MYNYTMNIAFFSSSPSALPILEKLNQDFAVKLVVTKPNSALVSWAEENKVVFTTPNTLKREEGYQVIKFIKDLNIDLILVIDYGLLIPRVVFDAPKLKTVNVHFSLLPKYRGPFPDAFVILNGDKKTGISFVLIEEGFDTGDILAQFETEVLPNETASGLHARLYKKTEELISYILNSWVQWKTDNNYNHYKDNNGYTSLFLPPKKQDHSAATFTKMLSREDGFKEWDEIQNLLKTNPQKLFNFYRAMTPWPGLWTLINNKRLKILKMHLENENLFIDEVQLEGKKPVRFKQFREAYYV